jgi:large conductance mechanosensitive channel
MRVEKKKKGFFSEFKEFALKGSVIDLAVGVIIGGAFATITTSLINDVIVPFVGLFIGGIDFSSWAVEVGPIFPGAEPSVINVGLFIQTVINFIVLALIIFIMVRSINKARDIAEARKKKEEVSAPAAPAGPTSEQLLADILAELKKK